MTIMVVKTNRRMSVEDMRKLHIEIVDQLPTRIVLLPYDCEYEITELDISDSVIEPSYLKRVIRVESK